MGTCNLLRASMTCPHCNTAVDLEIEMRFGDTRNLAEFVVGERYLWIPGRAIQHGGRPKNGDFVGEGYSECPQCRRDFFVEVILCEDTITAVRPDLQKAGYIPPDANQPPVPPLAAEPKTGRAEAGRIFYMASNLIRSAHALTSRFFKNEQDLHQMLELLMAARAQSDDWRCAHVGDLVFWFFMVSIHLDPQEFIRLWHDGDQLVGYAIFGEDPSFDVQVLPAYEWIGIEEQALDWVETRMAVLRQNDAQRWGDRLVSGSRQDNARRIAFLEQHGFKQGGEFSEVNMICPLDAPLPAPVVPAGYHVRAVAAAGEISHRAAAQRAVWRPWSVGDVSDEDYARLMQLPGYDRQLDVVAVAPDGVIAAYVNGWIDPLNRVGDFGPVGALPAYRRLGLTRAVLLECMRRMQVRGMQRVSVSTGVTNEPARRLYQSLGFRIVNQYLEYVKPG